nr:(-)-alpha-terpineol synthase-like [Ipomoea batatas]
MNILDHDLVDHALEMPLYWRMQRFEARWFVSVYEKRQNMKPVLLEFAKLDYNMVQAKYLEELKQLSRWNKDISLAEKMSFARDRLVEGFLWAIGCTPDPQFEYCRKIITKLSVLVTVLDDVYDIYGSLDELEIFTDVIQRWDVNAAETLPEYMKICFLAIFNSMNELGYDVLKDQGLSIITNTRKQDEMLRGDSAKSIQCYMRERRCSEEKAREYMNGLIAETWKKLNTELERIERPLPKEFRRTAMNVPRIAQFIYQHGDGFGLGQDEFKNRIMALLFEPIPMP